MTVRPSHRNRPGAAGALFAYVVMTAAALLTLAPIALSIMTALRAPTDFLSQGPLHLPDPPTLENVTQLFTREDSFITPFAVTAQMVAVILAGQIVFSVMAAYAFAFLRFRGRDALFWLFISTLMVPQVVVIIPLFLALSELGLRNTFFALVIPFVFGSPYAVFLLRQNFRSVPQELIDAMRVDGAGHLRILWNLVVPLNRPIIVTLVIITVVTHWNSFLWPLIITKGPDWRTLTVATSALSTQYNANWTLVMAATTLALIPLILLYFAFQKQVANSISGTELR
ncbi:carbohydrate ABC transporter permease [Helcobacillus massiliensis]|uniref:carbohydrate ABC transporter permease n=1 Tax=Helcobacillus TaxID=1161125 RepID=UPI001EF46E9F|nr:MULTISPECIES: carbohydrate ABC transporter permease [Helcobacillus]MCG7426316.1 carbohydrate ABC transporter permease [Helcobacillus sp. ACRRO]MCT1558459.1 carbohydrate ABC transporter permease [Helcobacillus massiliensis]MCT2037152.1 carbohydrate ABC transporter permease [Helcobacillus massiliensis]MCT2332088.1 carbohydrate ABC transporter permease [Helcobacillus massiliensis]MDK7742913.1 carbohydrate ABC transporter permease [Helcobacillus massiliensis]